ncbi:MAG: sigma-70 family RNA polymerase sigma factor [Chloroflexi bacterium]|nr:sigma-70 family RNA polymerase sigma factor [Chloroflexota bacterium]
MNQELRDEELVRQAQTGDEGAFTELVHRHENRVYTLALKMLRQPVDAEDVLQETFISALRGLKTFRGDASFSTWLYRIAYNATLMKLRRSSPVVSLDATLEGDESEMPRDLSDWTHDPEIVLLNQETQRAMQAAVETLSPALRSVFVLRDLDGLSTEETATVLAVSTQVVKTRLHRARLILRNELADYMSTRRDRERK